jgi:ERCC4-related helicase
MARTPQLHIEDLLRFVNTPSLREVPYEVEVPGVQVSSALRSLFSTMESIEVEKYVPALKRFSHHEAQSEYCGVVNRASRRMEACLKRLCNRAKHLQKELGIWATNYYLVAATDNLNSSPQSEGDIILNLDEHEKKYLSKVCASINRSNSRQALEPGKFPDISAKVEHLIAILATEHRPDFLGIIFVEQRATAIALHQLLSTHPKTKDLFRYGTFMGASKNPNSKDFGDLVNPKEQDQVLSDFSSGNKNLIIATSALEEGIDISGCNNVICFNKPQNIKSFIQRRGRARKVNSTFIIMVPADENISDTKNWQELDRQIIEACKRDRKMVEDLQKSENLEAEGDLTLKIESTGYVSA